MIKPIFLILLRNCLENSGNYINNFYNIVVMIHIAVIIGFDPFSLNDVISYFPLIFVNTVISFLFLQRCIASHTNFSRLFVLIDSNS